MTKYTLVSFEQAEQAERQQWQDTRHLLEVILDWGLRLALLAIVTLNTF